MFDIIFNEWSSSYLNVYSTKYYIYILYNIYEILISFDLEREIMCSYFLYVLHLLIWLSAFRTFSLNFSDKRK